MHLTYFERLHFRSALESKNNNKGCYLESYWGTAVLYILEKKRKLVLRVELELYKLLRSVNLSGCMHVTINMSILLLLK